jgi:hypothetical protein
MHIRTSIVGLFALTACGTDTPDGRGDSSDVGVTIDGRTEPPTDAQPDGTSHTDVARPDMGDLPEVDAPADATVAHVDAGGAEDAGDTDAWWRQVPPLCDSVRTYEADGPGAFELLATLAGRATGVLRVEGQPTRLLGVGPESTEDVPAGVALGLRDDGTFQIDSTGNAYGLSGLQRANAPGVLFATSSFPLGELPECGRDRGLSLAAIRLTPSTEPWSMEPITCIQPGRSAYWQRDLVIDSDLDGHSEVLTGKPTKLDEFRDGAFVRLYDDRPEVRLDPFDVIAGFAAGDVDGDGFVELSLPALLAQDVEPGAGRGVLRIVENRRENGFVVTQHTVSAAYTPYFNAIGDVDGDGRLEILHGGPADQCRSLDLYHAIADDTYAVRWHGEYLDPDAKHLGEARMGDTDGDGDQEIAIPLGCTVRVFEWQETELVDIAAIDTNPHCGYAEVFPGDFDGDGADELAVTTDWSALGQYPDPTGIQIWKRRR